MTPEAEYGGRRGAALLVAPALLPLLLLLLLVLLLAGPGIDEGWENHPAHFWLVLVAALLSVGLGSAVSVAGRRRRDARLFLISLALMASAGFLAMHALATPGVLLGKNAGFELATPVGLVVAAVVAAASGLELGTRASARIMRSARALFGALAALMLLWAILSLGELPPLDDPLQGEELDGWQISLAAAGVVLYSAAALAYLLLYLRRRHASPSRSRSPSRSSPRRWS